MRKCDEGVTEEILMKHRLEKYSDRSAGPEGCWLWTASKSKDGYGAISLWAGGSGAAHRASYEFYIGKIPDKMLVCHSCDNPPCINPAHLSLGTPQDNMDDMRAKGRSNYDKSPHASGRKGSDSYVAKLDENKVSEIRKRYAKGNVTQKNLAKEYNVSESSIWFIVKNLSWTHVKD